MFVKEIVTHERNIPLNAIILSKKYVGPLGTAKYTLQSEEELNIDEARPYRIVLLSALFNNYDMSHYLEMLKLFFVKSINWMPDNFIVNKFASTHTTHIYPIYKNDYLYVCKEEGKLLEFNPITLLGFYPITNDPMVWYNMRIPNPISWEDACLIRSAEDVSRTVGVDETVSEAIYNRRAGNKPEEDPIVLKYNRIAF